MSTLRWIQLALAACACALLAAPLAGGARPVLVAHGAGTVRGPAGPPDPDPALAVFLGTLTADDVARGVWDLAVTPGAPAPDPAQATVLAVPLAAARDHHRHLAGLEAERHRLRALVLEDGARIAGLTGGRVP